VELNSTTPSPTITNEVISLDVDGNAILDIEDLRSQKALEFLISTKVLSLASPVFAKMFGPHFEEGHRVRRGECPHIKLNDDDPHAMEAILRTLHYQSINQLHAIDAEMKVTTWRQYTLYSRDALTHRALELLWQPPAWPRMKVDNFRSVCSGHGNEIPLSYSNYLGPVGLASLFRAPR
jgi:hypothetical protein